MAYCFFGVSILHMETAFKVFSFVHGYVIIFEFKIFATSKFRAKKCYENQECEIRGCRKGRLFPVQFNGVGKCLAQAYFKP